MRTSALVVALALAATVVVAPANTYTSATVDRGSAVAVASDPNAAIAVDTPDTSGSAANGELATVTNQLDVSQTVTVRLENKTNEYDLSVTSTAGTVESAGGDSVRVSLSPGDSVTVGYAANGQPKGDARFTVETTGAVSATLPGRVRAIDEPGGGGPPGGGGGPPGGNCPPNGVGNKPGC